MGTHFSPDSGEFYAYKLTDYGVIGRRDPVSTKCRDYALPRQVLTPTDISLFHIRFLLLPPGLHLRFNPSNERFLG